MSQIIAVTSGKGGTGKSSVCTALGLAFAERNFKVIIIELDFGLRCLDIMLKSTNKVIYDLGDIINGNCRISDAIINSDLHHNLKLIAAPSSLEAVISNDNIFKLCSYLKQHIDIIILDTPAGLGVACEIIPKIADISLIISTPDILCVRDAAKINYVLQDTFPCPTALVINKFNEKSFKKGKLKDLDQAIDIVGAKLMGIIPYDEDNALKLTNGEYQTNNSVFCEVISRISYRLTGKLLPLKIN